MRVFPPVDVLTSYLGISPSQLEKPDGEVIPVKAELLQLLLKLALHQAPFDPDWYAGKYPDVADAVSRGEITSLKEHFVSTGYFENRLGAEVEVDADWYAATYPDISAAITEGRIASAKAHYNTVGKKEWRIPTPDAADEQRAWRKALTR
jgi:hypothetical protein